jgi:hypothetical protein
MVRHQAECYQVNDWQQIVLKALQELLAIPVLYEDGNAVIPPIEQVVVAVFDELRLAPRHRSSPF